MSQPVKLSDGLVLDARLTGKIVERSIAAQIEFWARLGRAIEPLLQGVQSLALCRADAVRPLSACLRAVDSPAGASVLLITCAPCRSLITSRHRRILAC